MSEYFEKYRAENLIYEIPPEYKRAWAIISAIRLFGQAVTMAALEALKEEPTLATPGIVRWLVDELEFWEGEAYLH